MQVNFDYEFKEIDGSVSRNLEIVKDEKGNPVRDSDKKPILQLGAPFTLKSACLNVLQSPPVEIDPRTGRQVEIKAEDKLMWADLVMRIYKCNGTMELSSSEQELLKNFINKRYNNPLMVRQAFEQLDPASVKKPS